MRLKRGLMDFLHQTGQRGSAEQRKSLEAGGVGLWDEVGGAGGASPPPSSSSTHFVPARQGGLGALGLCPGQSPKLQLRPLRPGRTESELRSRSPPAPPHFVSRGGKAPPPPAFKVH